MTRNSDLVEVGIDEFEKPEKKPAKKSAKSAKKK